MPNSFTLTLLLGDSKDNENISHLIKKSTSFSLLFALLLDPLNSILSRRLNNVVIINSWIKCFLKQQGFSITDSQIEVISYLNCSIAGLQEKKQYYLLNLQIFPWRHLLGKYRDLANNNCFHFLVLLLYVHF